ncbi:hypothetical protein PLICRDRAFT_35882 [Plicaturopsis crispa FD-325 SS-3]|nr:hypothetical protein PLICRDRAFT_35882 [Plicaturopsis crispa FD-325 SS-3]
MKSVPARSSGIGQTSRTAYTPFIKSSHVPATVLGEEKVLDTLPFAYCTYSEFKGTIFHASGALMCTDACGTTYKFKTSAYRP